MSLTAQIAFLVVIVVGARVWVDFDPFDWL